MPTRGLVSGVAMAPPDFGRSVNPISTMGDRLCLNLITTCTQIFRPSDGPAHYISRIVSTTFGDVPPWLSMASINFRVYYI
jgi:hypothetical protein